MIQLIGPEDAPEYQSACQLRDLIAAAWPDVADETNTDDQVHIVAAAKCYGQKVVDIDLVVFVTLTKLREVSTEKDGLPICVRSLCLTVEVKSHEPDGIRIEGNQVRVRYGNRDSNATEQAHRQQASLRNFYEAHGYQPPFVTELVWLPRVPQEMLPEACHNIIGTQATWQDILDRVVAMKRPKPWRPNGLDWYEIDAFGRCDRKSIASLTGLLTRKIEISPLDRRKLEVLSSRKVLKGQSAEYVNKLGEQLLIFRGRGGTGKTVHLLRFAHELYIERNARVLILTYNKALVADIRRMLAIMGVGDVFAERSIEVRTVHSFLYRLREYLDQKRMPPERFIPQFQAHRSYILKRLQKARVDQQDPLVPLVQVAPDLFAWDYILIDEAQDWPDEERSILFLLYDYRRFIVADGVDQYVRDEKPTDWRLAVDAEKRQYIQLRKSLRLKAGLCTFALSLAGHLGLDDWRLEKDESVFGGRVMILEGNYAEDRSLHDQLVDRASRDGNKPIDMLFCVPPSLVKRSRDLEGYSVVARKFSKWGYKVWDGVSGEVRGTYPTDLDQLRVVQYDSCRGLEGWTTVNLRFDELYDYKLSEYHPPAQTSYIEEDRAAHTFAARWLMIPITRAIDTLVIQINSSDNLVGEALKAAARDCADLVEWHRIEAASPMTISPEPVAS
jgi:hypothetical protein